MEELKPGQFISGRKKLAEELEQSEREIRTSLERLVTLQILTIKTTNKYSIYTIVNYEKYQFDELTSTSTSTNKQPTSNQQATTKQEVKKERTVLNGWFEKFWDAYGKKVGRVDAEREWVRLSPDDSLAEEIVAAATSYAVAKPDKQFRKDPVRWLKAKSWADEIVVPDSAVKKPSAANWMNAL
jgi:DNA replication protein DnaD